MPNRPSPLPLVLILLALAALGGLAFAFQHVSDTVAGLPPTKAAPTGSGGPTPNDAAGCAAAGGIWNDCASACPAGGSAPCIDVCVAKCEGLDGQATARAYFVNRQYDASDAACANAYPVKRQVTKGDGGYPQAALGELLKGPSDDEAAAGYTSDLPQGTALKSLTVANGVAIADFTDPLAHVFGSCPIRAARAQIEDTLTQFPWIHRVEITIEGGDPAQALQP